MPLRAEGPQDFEATVSPWASASPFGVNVSHPPTPEEVEALAEVGGHWARTHHAPWAAVERERDVYAFAPELPRTIQGWHDADIQVLDVLGHGNPLYTGAADAMAPPSGPAQIEAFANYVRVTVGHFRRWVTHWEVWGDLNPGGPWKPAHFLDAHLALSAAYQAAKSADPKCVVVGGVLSGAPLPLLERFLNLGAAHQMDVVAVHPRNANGAQPLQDGEYLEELQAIRRLVDGYRRGLPLWITQIGWATSPTQRGVSPEVQADYLVRMYALSLAAGVERVFWHEFRDAGQYGLVQLDLGLNPSYGAYRTMTRLLEGATCEGRAEAPPGVWAIAFRKHNRDILVCWAPERPTEVELLGAGISRWDVAGQAARVADGPVRVTLGPSPVFAAGHDVAVVSAKA